MKFLSFITMYFLLLLFFIFCLKWQQYKDFKLSETIVLLLGRKELLLSWNYIFFKKKYFFFVKACSAISFWVSKSWLVWKSFSCLYHRSNFMFYLFSFVSNSHFSNYADDALYILVMMWESYTISCVWFLISASNHTFGRAIWDKFPECIYENFAIWKFSRIRR